MPAIVARSTTDELFGSECVSWNVVAGPSTSRWTRPTSKESPTGAEPDGRQCCAASRFTISTPDSGSANGLTDEPPDPALVVGARDAADVVEVEVGQHEQRDLADAQAGQAPVDQHRIRARVDLDGHVRDRR